jgi:hypothetical protein
MKSRRRNMPSPAEFAAKVSFMTAKTPGIGRRAKPISPVYFQFI